MIKMDWLAKNTFCVVKSLEHLKNLRTGRILNLGLELTMHVFKSPIHLVRQSLYNIEKRGTNKELNTTRNTKRTVSENREVS